MGGEPGHHAEFWLFRTSRAREAILENTLLKKRPGERIQQQPQPFMVEFSTGSAEEPDKWYHNTPRRVVERMIANERLKDPIQAGQE